MNDELRGLVRTRCLLDVRPVSGHGVRTDSKRRGNLTARQPLTHEPQHIELSRRQRALPLPHQPFVHNCDERATCTVPSNLERHARAEIGDTTGKRNWRGGERPGVPAMTGMASTNRCPSRLTLSGGAPQEGSAA